MENPIEILTHKLNKAGLMLDVKTVKRNEFVFQSGQVNSNLYFVKSGSARIFINDNGQEHNIRFGYKDSFISALDSFINGAPTDFYMQAIKKSELVLIDKERYIQFIQSDSENITLWNKLLEILIYQQIEREVDLLTASPSERYNRVLKRSPQLFQEIPNRYIANYLRMTPETLSRIKKTLI